MHTHQDAHGHFRDHWHRAETMAAWVENSGGTDGEKVVDHGRKPREGIEVEGKVHLA